MVLDSRILKVKQHFGIFDLEKWTQITPEQVLQIPDVGPVTLEHVRLYLAARNLTLRGDQTPEYWKQHLSESRIGHTMGEEDIAVACPFLILIDELEKHPFCFRGMSADSDQHGLPVIVTTEFRSLGVSMGDYSIDGYVGQCHIERKSMDDAHGTILGWGERRERFVRELETLAEIDCAAVVVECTLADLIQNAPSRGKKSQQENAKILFRQVLAWTQDYRVPWHFCDGRRLAEMATFRILERYWDHETQKRKAAAKPAKEVKVATESVNREREALASLF